MTLKIYSIQGTITTNVCTKSENNPTSGFLVITFAPLQQVAST